MSLMTPLVSGGKMMSGRGPKRNDGNYDAGEEEAEEEGVTGSLLMMPLLMNAESEPEGEPGVQLSSLILNT